MASRFKPRRGLRIGVEIGVRPFHCFQYLHPAAADGPPNFPPYLHLRGGGWTRDGDVYLRRWGVLLTMGILVLMGELGVVVALADVLLLVMVGMLVLVDVFALAVVRI